MSVGRCLVASTSTKTDTECFLITSSVPIALGIVFFFFFFFFYLLLICFSPQNEDSLSRVECLGTFISRVSGLTASKITTTTTIKIIVTVDFITAGGILMFRRESKIAGSWCKSEGRPQSNFKTFNASREKKRNNIQKYLQNFCEKNAKSWSSHFITSFSCPLHKRFSFLFLHTTVIEPTSFFSVQINTESNCFRPPLQEKD